MTNLSEETGKTFRWCLERKTPGLRRVTPDMDRARAHLAKARGNLEAMAYLHKGGYFEWIVNTGYYAMYHAALALLLSNGIEGKDHNCVVVALRHLNEEMTEDAERMTEAQKLEKKMIEDLDKARVARINIQYGVTKVVATDVDWLLPASRNLVNKIEEKLHRKKP